MRIRKVSIKSHSRRTRGGRRIVVRSYRRGVSIKGLKSKAQSKTEFEHLKEMSPYGEHITKRLHTFQGDDEDGLYGIRRYSGDKITEHRRKLRKLVIKS